MTFFNIAISHCEGPDHLDRMHVLAEFAERIIAKMPPQLAEMGDGFRAQNARVTKIIETFGRHPHRNEILGRPSTPAEKEYIAQGDFPHLRNQPDAGEGS